MCLLRGTDYIFKQDSSQSKSPIKRHSTTKYAAPCRQLHLRYTSATQRPASLPLSVHRSAGLDTRESTYLTLPRIETGKRSLSKLWHPAGQCHHSLSPLTIHTFSPPAGYATLTSIMRSSRRVRLPCWTENCRSGLLQTT